MAVKLSTCLSLTFSIDFLLTSIDSGFVLPSEKDINQALLSALGYHKNICELEKGHTDT